MRYHNAASGIRASLRSHDYLSGCCCVLRPKRSDFLIFWIPCRCLYVLPQLLRWALGRFERKGQCNLDREKRQALWLQSSVWGACTADTLLPVRVALGSRSEYEPPTKARTSSVPLASFFKSESTCVIRATSFCKRIRQSVQESA